MPKNPPTRSGPISATGFPSIRSSAKRERDRQCYRAMPLLHGRRLTIYLSSNMDNSPILFLDSGVGGIPYCRHFCRHDPAETIYYLADRAHFPYGTRGREELAAILTATIEKLDKIIAPKITVLACNTATVSALSELRQHFPERLFVGTVPAVKPAIKTSKTGKVGVLGTARTIADPYIRDLAGDDCEICGIAAPELVEFVERRFALASQDEKSAIAKMYIERFRAAGADTLVLGCTHFLFLLDEFRKEAEPSIKVFDSMEGITHRIESLLNDNNGALRGEPCHEPDTENNPPPQNKLLLTGTEAPEPLWQNLAEQLNFSLSLLDQA